MVPTYPVSVPQIGLSQRESEGGIKNTVRVHFISFRVRKDDMGGVAACEF
jgi:hypothetical protein